MMTGEHGDFGAGFEPSLDRIPAGYSEGDFDGRRWKATVKRSADGRRVWLFAEEMAGGDIVSFNFYRLSQQKTALKPCEMSTSKVMAFVLGYQPDEAFLSVRADD
ncbi:hypothetical protein [Rhizobium sp. SAFR-030]|uniref:hypothetical protein n=1 Tax=Rhizobium sp. SAFR-030 TaxID=3387277 RepID=UPI003F80D11C